MLEATRRQKVTALGFHWGDAAIGAAAAGGAALLIAAATTGRQALTQALWSSRDRHDPERKRNA